MDGVCADCWGQKEGEPKFFFRRTQGSWLGDDFFPFDWSPVPAFFVEALVAVVVIGLVVVYALGR